MPEIETISDIEIFEKLDFPADKVSCDYEQCKNEAVNMLQCGACMIGHECICSQHTTEIRITQMMVPEWPIRFDRTCGHNPELGQCSILPLP